jgi:hypothetical protein
MTKRLPAIVPSLDPLIISTIEHWYDLLAEAMTSEAGRAFMQQEFLRQLELSDAATLPTAEIIAAAEAGNEAADRALRVYAMTRMDQWQQLSVQLQAYVIRALGRAPVTYPRGETDVADTWTRDIAVGVLVDLTAQRFGLPPAYKRGVAALPASYFVSHVLRARGYKLGEQQVGRIHRNRHKLAQRIGASLYPALGAF